MSPFRLTEVYQTRPVESRLSVGEIGGNWTAVVPSWEVHFYQKKKKTGCKPGHVQVSPLSHPRPVPLPSSISPLGPVSPDLSQRPLSSPHRPSVSSAPLGSSSYLRPRFLASPLCSITGATAAEPLPELPQVPVCLARVEGGGGGGCMTRHPCVAAGGESDTAAPPALVCRSCSLRALFRKEEDTFLKTPKQSYSEFFKRPT